VAPPLSSDPSAAADELAAYAEAGTERVILSITETEWQRSYDRAAHLHSALADTTG
jgi:hypothetical protein